MEFFAIDKIDPQYFSRFDDGVIGLAPPSKGGAYENLNLMSQMIKNGIISSHIFSVLFTADKGGHIKFGGWDAKGIEPNTENLTMIHTLIEDTWQMKFKDFQIDDRDISAATVF